MSGDLVDEARQAREEWLDTEPANWATERRWVDRAMRLADEVEHLRSQIAGWRDAHEAILAAIARVEALPVETVHVHAGGGNLTTDRRVIDADKLNRALKGGERDE